MLFNVKKITFFIVSALALNICVLPHASLLAIKPPIIKDAKNKINKTQQSETSQKEAEQQEENNENPTFMDSWHKVITLEWGKLTRADAWNIAGPMAGIFCLYALTRYMPASNNPLQGNTPNNNNNPGPDQNQITQPNNNNNENNNNNNISANNPNPENPGPKNDNANDLINNNATQPNTTQDNTNGTTNNNDTINDFDITSPIKDNSQPNNNKPSQESTVSSQQSIPVKTIRVPQQIVNSCAYHALNNGMKILFLLESEEIINLQNNFPEIRKYISLALRNDNSINTITELFDEKNNSGTWRTLIINQREEPVLKNCIFEKLTNSIPLTENQKNAYIAQLENYIINLNNWYQKRIKDGFPSSLKPIYPKKPASALMETPSSNALRNIANACANQLINSNEPINLITNSHEELTNNLIDRVNTYNQSLLNGTRETYEVSINLLNSHNLQSNFGNAMAKNDLLASARQNNNRLIGNDLDEEELSYVMMHGGPDGGAVPHSENISIVARIRMPEWAENGNGRSLDEAIMTAQLKMRNDNCMHAFLIRIGFSEIQNDIDERRAASHGTHWISVVLHRVNGHNQYIIADSMNNPCGDHPDVLHLIRTLES